MTGAPLNSVQLIPGAVLDHLGLQLESDDGTLHIPEEVGRRFRNEVGH
jgi:hypothetical protein